ncbi:phasin family protein [Roseomonas sp. SSH11]|uniref:Phasin family protein n=1 Tax=Pararoseomonas baculiformis TaxID=2820812 RepID=A0ABS4AMY3_9PROT|nr:phasin family protein [Pararoseomonas baculiformis]MBP0447878.1 phasin family protein [Pararoseomonas baculiformis]
MFMQNRMPHANDVMASISEAATKATELNRANLEAATRSAQLWTMGLQDIGQRYLAMYQGMAEGFATAAKAIAAAKSPQEAATIQTSYFKTARDQVTGQATQIGEATAQLFNQASAPLAEQATAASAMMAPRKRAA